MAAPKTEKWTARENLHNPEKEEECLYLLVSGNVEVSPSNQAPQLAAGASSGKVLALELTLNETSEDPIEHEGRPVAVWKAASYSSECAPDEYEHVEVRWQGDPIATFPVINDVEHQAIVDKQTDVQNKVAAKTMERPARKAKKAVARVVEAVEDAAKGARKVVKKVLKKAKKAVAKAPKKTVKAAAKKSRKKASAKAVKKARAARAPAKKSARHAPARKAAKKKTRRR